MKEFMYPSAMIQYLIANGWHFNEKALQFAISLMYKRNPATKQKEPIKPYSKEEVDEILKKHGVTLENNQLCDYVYVANVAKADLMGSSIEDEKHLALYVKDEIDDIDRNDGVIMKVWYTMVYGNGKVIPWDDLVE